MKVPFVILTFIFALSSISQAGKLIEMPSKECNKKLTDLPQTSDSPQLKDTDNFEFLTTYIVPLNEFRSIQELKIKNLKNKINKEMRDGRVAPINELSELNEEISKIKDSVPLFIYKDSLEEALRQFSGVLKILKKHNLFSKNMAAEAKTVSEDILSSIKRSKLSDILHNNLFLSKLKGSSPTPTSQAKMFSFLKTIDRLHRVVTEESTELFDPKTGEQYKNGISDRRLILGLDYPVINLVQEFDPNWTGSSLLSYIDYPFMKKISENGYIIVPSKQNISNRQREAFYSIGILVTTPTHYLDEKFNIDISKKYF